MNVDIIIPVYRPDDTFCLLLQGLREQTFLVHVLILLNTEEALWEEAKRKYPIAECLDRMPCEVALFHVKKEAFDHGGTRMLGAKHSDADVLVFMTQDAVPADAHLIEQLVRPFAGEKPEGGMTVSNRTENPAVPLAGKDPKGGAADFPEGSVAAAYARQLPNAACNIVESYTRQFNYPENGYRKSRADLGRLGIKTYFCSDVCAAYRRDLFLALGGFESPVIFNEDMFFAAKAINAGFAVEYAAEAKVIHSHNYTAAQQFHRNFDLAVSQADHPEIFAGIRSASEGVKLVVSTMRHLCRIGKPWLIASLVWQCAGKYAGYFLGKRYRRLGRKWIVRCTMSPDYWRRRWEDEDRT